ncbi:MAG: 6-bladed beta-propeller, partial [Candidatus Thorarchaeota archaeon]|nr:6-bladed beta-propeller [Candidatus Thorarchaeota archaeon]
MKRTTLKLMVFALGALLILSMAPQALPNFTPSVDYQEIDAPDDSIDESLLNLNLDGDFNLTNDYQQFWEPNNIQGSSRAVAVSESNNFMAASGGWMNDAELHIYRWFEPTLQYVHVWDSGDGEFGGDITDLEFMDCDSNGRLEIVAACQDGKIYIYEALGIETEPFQEIEDCNVFEQVWNSGYIMDQQVWDIELNDIDHDSQTEIIAACWDGKVYVFDYIDHSAWPYCQEEHWIQYEPVWDSGDTITDRVNTVVVGDTDRDLKSEIIAGSQDGIVYLFEEKPCLHHVYDLKWTSGDSIWRPINAIAFSTNFDGDFYGEFAVSAYGQGVYVFHYDYGTDDYYVKKINREPELWEQGATVLDPPVYTGYEVDPYIDRKEYGWADQGVNEYDPIPYPWSTPELGGASALGGPPDYSQTTFSATEQLNPLYTWTYEEGSAPGQLNYPYGLAVAPDGFVYLAEYYNDRVSVFDPSGNLLFTFGETGNETGQFDGPSGVEVDEEGFVYVSEALNGRVQKFDPSGGFLAEWGANGSALGQFFAPMDLALGHDGELYVADAGNNRIVVMDRYNGTFYDEIVGSGSTELITPMGVSIGPLGYVYVSDTGNDRMIVFDSGGSYVRQWGGYGAGDGDFNQPIFSTITDDGMVYVSDFSNARVQKFTLQGTYVSQFGGLGVGPGQFAFVTGIDIDSQGLVKAVDLLAERIHTFGVLDYTLEDIIGDNYGVDGGLGYPLDVGQDPEGNIYVPDWTGSVVVKYAEDGTYLTNWSLPGGGQPLAIQVEDNGEIFLSDYTGDRIHVTDYEGNLIRSFGSPGANPGEF